MDALNVIRQMIASGVLEIRPNGEIWKLARISSSGRIVSITPKRAECTLKNGYLGIVVWSKGKQFLSLAHRVVWTILVGEIPSGMDLNHKDGNKKNNNPANLEVVTRGENLKHAAHTGLRVYENLAHQRANEATVLRNNGLSYAEIARNLGISPTTAFRAVKEKPTLL